MKSVDPPHLVRHFAEPDDVWPHASGQSAKGTREVDGKIVPPGDAMRAISAQRFEKLAVHMNERLRTCRLVQRIDVLRDDRHAVMLRLETRERQMRRVRLDIPVCTSSRIIEVVNQNGISQKAVGGRDVPPIVFRPDAVRIAKRRNTAFGR